MRSWAALLAIVTIASLQGCGSPPPFEPPPLESRPLRATVRLKDEGAGELRLRQLRVMIPASLLNPQIRLVDGFDLRLSDESERRVALADLTRIEVVGRVLNRLQVKVVAKGVAVGTVDAGLIVRGEGPQGFHVQVRLEETRAITLRH